MEQTTSQEQSLETREDLTKQQSGRNLSKIALAATLRSLKIEVKFFSIEAPILSHTTHGTEGIGQAEKDRNGDTWK